MFIFIVVVVVLAGLFGYMVRTAGEYKSKKRTSPLQHPIQERLMKILYNPFNDKWMWTQFNPITHTWEWFIDALEHEVEMYEEPYYTEERGMEIIRNRKESING